MALRALDIVAVDALRRVAPGFDDASAARKSAALANTGIAWSPVTINFGWDIVRWLVERFPRQAEIDSFGDNGVALATILAAASVQRIVRL